MKLMINRSIHAFLEQRKIKNKIVPHKFHTKKGAKFNISASLLSEFLVLNGFCLHKGELILLIKGFAIEVTPQMLFNFGLEYIRTFKNQELTDEYIKQAESYLISKRALIGSLPETTLTSLKDKKNAAYFPFNDKISEVTANGINKKEYDELKDEFVWIDDILDRNAPDTNEVSVFEQFDKNVTNDEKHLLSVKSTKGYLLHSHKSPDSNKAVILSDVLTEAENRANGRTGKGLQVQALFKFRKGITQNGKNLDLSNNRFAFQDVTLRTNLFLIDDAKKDFPFEDLFSVITGDWGIEKKNKPTFTIPFSETPKIILTTNYRIAGNSSSHNGRRFNVYLNNHYNEHFTPFDDFGHYFFDDWDLKEWARFDSYMISCVQLYLRKGLIPYKNKEMELRKIINEIGKEAFEKLEQCELNEVYLLKKLGLPNFSQVYQFADFKGLQVVKSKYNGVSSFKFNDVTH